MPAKIHYEDNLFFLHSIVRTIESGLRLDIDPDLFRDKVLDDLFFVDATIMRIYSSLRENDHLIKRVVYLRSLRRAVAAYTTFLNRLMEPPPVLEGTLEQYREKLASIRSGHDSLRQEIEILLDQMEPNEENRSIISSEEYGFLLAREAAPDSPVEE